MENQRNYASYSNMEASFLFRIDGLHDGPKEMREHALKEITRVRLRTRKRNRGPGQFSTAQPRKKIRERVCARTIYRLLASPRARNGKERNERVWWDTHEQKRARSYYYAHAKRAGCPAEHLYPRTRDRKGSEEIY